MYSTKIYSRFFSTSIRCMKEIQKVTVIGSGVMGSGVGQISAQGNCNVTIVDRNEACLRNSKIVIIKSIERIAKKKFGNDNHHDKEEFTNGILDKIKYTTNLNYAVSDCDLIIETIVEDLGIKKQLFKNIEKHCKDDTIITTNTSSLALEKLSEDLKNKHNFGGLHFFNPVPMMKLVEVITIKETSKDVTECLIEFCKKIGKTPVQCKDTPGYIVNRLLYPYLFDAIKLHERGDATKEDIDKAMKLGASYPMGPFELADFIGLDILKSIMEHYPDKKSQLLDKLLEEHKYGIKSGEGFYKY
uniref:3-hydroxyacyl-CoA dehydrogenase n=1 Tax=Parastrongyloides trichosuri TaxID=131310 RepID=A0A0N4ZM46_PARTI